MKCLQKVALGDVATFVRGLTFKPTDVVPLGSSGSIACMRTKNVQAELNTSDVWAIPEQQVTRLEKRLKCGDILVSTANSLSLVGRCSWVPELAWPATFGGFVTVLRANPDRVNPRYLYWWLSSGRTQAALRARASKTTNIANLNVERCRQLQLHLPPLPEQRRIAEVLDRAEALRAKRRAALALLDTLTQSIFLEMFGDPVINPQGLPEVVLGDVITSVSDGPHVSPTYIEAGVPFLSTRHVRAGEITWSDIKYLSLADAEVQWKKCKPRRDDILYTKGGTTGLAAVVNTDEPFAVWVHLALLRPDGTKVEPIWLESMLNSPFCYAQSQRFTHGIANRDLGLTRMVNIKMVLPPLDHQRTFVHRRRILDALREKQRASLASFDVLFASLQDRAFRGEL